MSIWITAMLMGVAGSLHCIGMCGPLVIAATSLQPRIVANKLLYNTGRVLTYGLLGMITGTIALLIDLAGFQRILSIALGSTLMVLAFAGISRLNIPGLTHLLGYLQAALKKAFSKFIGRKGKSTMFLLGMLNGILPCGLTYVALAYTLTLGPFEGFVFMVLFGIATFPAMLGLASIFHRGLLKLKFDAGRMMLPVMLITGILLVARTYAHHEPPRQASEPITVCEE